MNDKEFEEQAELAIHEYCKECMNKIEKEPENCQFTNCPLWTYRVKNEKA